VRFEGRVNDAGRMAELYAAHDLLALTSHREGFPLVVMEAMAQGLAILATPVGDVPNRLDASCAVVTSSVERAVVLREMEAAVLDLDTDRPRLQAMKRTALNKARVEYDPERFRQRYRELLMSPAP
jgi:glycosyltransferase involved in cell wall biosynthesis